MVKEKEGSGAPRITSSEANKLREFRKLVTSRKEPSTVIFLRRLVLVMTALMLGILSVETALKFNFYKGYESLQTLRASLEEITLDLMHVESGFRSLINLHNDIYQDEIPGLVAKGDFSTSILARLSEYLNSINSNKNVFLVI